MEDRIVRTLDLANGLKLQLIDDSRQIAADRYSVRLKLRIEIPVDGKWFDSMADPSVEDVKTLLGPHVVFEREEKRNFVDKDEKDAVVDAMVASVVESGTPYYGLPSFPARCILKVYKDRSKKASFPQEA